MRLLHPTPVPTVWAFRPPSEEVTKRQWLIERAPALHAGCHWFNPYIVQYLNHIMLRTCDKRFLETKNYNLLGTIVGTKR